MDLLRAPVSVLDVDPDLAIGIASGQLDTARSHAVASAITVNGRGWDPAAWQEHASSLWLGLLLVDGLMLRCVTVGRRAACELIGPGDLLRPWDADSKYEPLSVTVSWRVLEPSLLAVLDESFAVRISCWPSVSAQLVGRIAHRARYQALGQAIMQVPRVNSRLLILFSLLAERWGRVRPDGIRITLPLTHELLGMLIGAQRPSVTLALGRLGREGLLGRERYDRWLLTQRGIECLNSMATLEAIDDVTDTVTDLPVTQVQLLEGLQNPRPSNPTADLGVDRV